MKTLAGCVAPHKAITNDCDGNGLYSQTARQRETFIPAPASVLLKAKRMSASRVRKHAAWLTMYAVYICLLPLPSRLGKHAHHLDKAQ